jgi:hypothetical protein
MIRSRILATLLLVEAGALAQASSVQEAARAAVHPVSEAATMRLWLARVPTTRDFPPDFNDTLSSHGSMFMIEMTSVPDCLPCGDLWAKLSRFRARYGWPVRVLSRQDALVRSGRLGLPWIGHPVAWVRPVSDVDRTVPIAMGTDHEVNVARNAYLAAKMLTGVRAAVGLRAMSKFTGIVGNTSSPPARRPGR